LTKRALVIYVLVFLGVTFLGAGLALRFSPFPELSRFLGRPYSTRVYDRRGTLLWVRPLEEGLRREWYGYDQIPERVREVFVAAEDRNFFRHLGVDPGAILRAAFQNASQGRTVSGASTITMQLARMVCPRRGGKVTLGRKIAEALNALRIEARLSKKEILELYLNALPFGSNVEGVGSAARTLFGKTPYDLTDPEIHALAVIPRRPGRYNPVSNPQGAYAGAIELGALTGFAAAPEEWGIAMAGAGTYVYPALLSHCVRFALSKFDVPPPELRLTVDAALSLEAEALIRARLSEYADARITDGAALAVDNASGEILVWAESGGADGEIDGVLVKNQSGSAMKPFLYALALEMGFPPSTALPDVPSDFGAAEVYVPLNFNNRYNGPALLRNALASSLNVPAVYLLYRIGVDNYLEKLAALGFDSLGGLRDGTGLSLALGSGEVTLYELVRAFSVFARDGVLPALTLNRAEKSAPGERVYKKDTARIICSFLSDRAARASGFAFSRVLAPPYPAIFKTGTANQFQDITALGGTVRYTAGVWMGNFSGETVIGKTGSSIPAEVARSILDALTAGDEGAGERPQGFPLPEAYALRPVCALSGRAPGPDCPAVTEEFALAGLGEALGPCLWHYREGGRVRTRFPDAYGRWFSGANTGAALFETGEPLGFLYPLDGAVFVYEDALPAGLQQISVDCAGGRDSRARLFAGGEPLGERGRPFSWTVPLSRGTTALTVECGGERASITFTVK
jgi:penicillin-binding protein 1C